MNSTMMDKFTNYKIESQLRKQKEHNKFHIDGSIIKTPDSNY